MTSYPVNISRRLRRHATAALTAAAALTMQSCSDALESLYGPEGENTTVSLSIELPQMAVQTRSDISDEQASEVDKVWVGIYDARTGLRKTALTVDKNESPYPHDRKLLVDRIKTTSGMSHIAAVANITRNFGVMIDEPDAGLQPIADLLDQADTWDKFQRIVTKQTLSGNVNAPIGALPMSGIYYGEKTTDPDNWVEAYQTPYYIPAGDNITMPGAVHLRRLLSQSRFNIISGANVTVTPISWQVFNTPDVVYIYEHETNATDDMETAFGHKYNVRSGLFHTFSDGTAKLSDGTEKDCVTFDFWQFENKHDGLEKYDLGNGDYYGAETYADRDREWKDEDTGENTGLYKSLCSMPEYGTYNNATYVEIKAKVDYYVRINAGTGAETVVAPGTSGAVHRIGYSTYTVHLGYCEGENESEKSRDFNCRRNTRYIYNVTIEGLNKIKVEAEKNGEPQPGAYGDITDIGEGGTIELDAHYCSFNIQLTYRQRENLKWLVRAPFGDSKEAVTIFSEDYEDGGIYAGQPIPARLEQFYKWVRFKPSFAEKTLRVYNDGGTNSDLMTLQDLKDVNKHKGVRRTGSGTRKDPYSYNEVDNNETNKDTPLWYTVFVDEYAYEKDLNGNTMALADGWKQYVNKDPRMLWLVINDLKESTDKESMYIDSDFLIAQKSMITYYNDNATTALGIEHENELFGFNLGWSTNADNNLTPNSHNGRYNVWTNLTKRSRKWSDVAKTSTISNYSPLGKNITVVEACTRNAITGNVQYPLANEPAEPSTVTKPVYMPASFDYGSRWPSDKDLSYNPVAGYQPQYEVIEACMNRNRDEDGDGVIDASELKWYVPTANRYIRIVLGRNSVQEPLMDFSLTPYFNGYNGESDNNSRFHFASSDKIILWAEEGTSTSNWESTGWEKGAWQVRCVRNLGVSPNSISYDDQIEMAYTLDKNNNTFEMSSYKTEVLRAGIVGHLSVHDVASERNQPSYKFEYAKEDCSDSNSNSDLLNGYSLKSYSRANWITYVNNNSICGSYSQEADGSDKGTWRVPNQKELIMMYQEGFFTEGNTCWMSCTREHYDMKKAEGSRRFIVAFNGNMTVSDAFASRRVRCVRDIIR